MSATLSTSAMIARLSVKHPIGIGAVQWLDFLNEAFRRVNQQSKGGFIWQLKETTLVIPAAVQSPVVAMPADFDAGKSAFLIGDGVATPTATIIPYKTPSEFGNEQHFQSAAIGSISCWTFIPNRTLAPGSYLWSMLFAPKEAFPLLPPGATLTFLYHAVSFAPLANGANVFFPTPDQFDSLIMDFAEAEARRQYRSSGWAELLAQATTSLNELIGTYRTDRFNLAGLQDITAQAQEKAAERDR